MLRGRPLNNTGKQSYDGIMSNLVRERKIEENVMDICQEDPYTVSLLSLIYSSLSPKTVKDLVPILGYRVINQMRAYKEARTLLQRTSTEDSRLLELFFTLLDECPPTVLIATIEQESFPPLLTKLLATVLVAQRPEK